MWRYGVALADAGWHADAVDLRGHGVAPRALDYTIAAYAADLAATEPDGGGAWDLVVGHSLGGAAATVAARGCTRLDAAPGPRSTLRSTYAPATASRAGEPGGVLRRSASEAAVRAEPPAWHEQDIELKALSARQASRWAVEQTSAQNAAVGRAGCRGRADGADARHRVRPERLLDLHGATRLEELRAATRARLLVGDAAPATRRTATSPRPRSRSSCASLGR